VEVSWKKSLNMYYSGKTGPQPLPPTAAEMSSVLDNALGRIPAERADARPRTGLAGGGCGCHHFFHFGNSDNALPTRENTKDLFINPREVGPGPVRNGWMRHKGKVTDALGSA
jgi:hypothetical protein